MNGEHYLEHNITLPSMRIPLLVFMRTQAVCAKGLNVER